MKREMAQLDAEIDELRQVSLDDIPQHEHRFLKLDKRRQKRMTREQKRRWISTAEAVRVAHANADNPVPHLTTTIASDNRLLTDWITTT